jgi:hypothetical protein
VLLRELAEARGVTDSVLVEHLTIEESKRAKLIDDDDPRAAFKELSEEIVRYLDSRNGRFDEHVTLDVFNEIKKTRRLASLHASALKPPSRQVTAEQRRQFVHQRIGRLVKEHLGWESGDEVTLPRGSEALIRSYTRLHKK